jgi:hypothetical protein
MIYQFGFKLYGPCNKVIQQINYNLLYISVITALNVTFLFCICLASILLLFVFRIFFYKNKNDAFRTVMALKYRRLMVMQQNAEIQHYQ